MLKYTNVLKCNYEIVYDTCVVKYCVFIYVDFSWIINVGCRGAWTLKINLQQTLPNKLYLFVKRRFNFFKKSL